MDEGSAWTSETDLFADEEEKKLIFSVLDSFSQYRRTAHYNTTHVRRQSFYALPRAHQDYLRGPPISFLDTLNDVDDCIDANADLADAIATAGAASLGIDVKQGEDPPWHGTATKHNIEKCRSTLNQLFRDWSLEGETERNACIAPIITDLERYLPIPANSTRQQSGATNPRVLVPGAGLGRLVFELCRAGYDAQGNEVSYHQLFASSYILNCTRHANQWPLYPFVLSFANHLARTDQLRKVMVPDVHPTTAMKADLARNAGGSMSMTTGDFCVLYRSEDYTGMFDAVATVFFIDTAPNLIRYVETVRNCLGPGGIWINVGPLLWHSEAQKEAQSDLLSSLSETEDRGIGEPGSFELSQDEVVKLVEDFGFEFLESESSTISTGYMQDRTSLLLNIYRPVHWVARKK